MFDFFISLLEINAVIVLITVCLFQSNKNGITSAVIMAVITALISEAYFHNIEEYSVQLVFLKNTFLKDFIKFALT